MMETYNTQQTDDNHLWLQELREIALKQAEEKEKYQPHWSEYEKILQGTWQQLFLQGWKFLFNPRPLASQETSMELQKNSSEEASVKDPETRERSDISCETSQEGSNEQKLSLDLRREGTDIKSEERLREHHEHLESSLGDPETEKIEEMQEKSQEVLELSQPHLDHPPQPEARDLNSLNNGEERHLVFGEDMSVTCQQESYTGEVHDKDRDGIGLQSHPKRKVLSWRHLWPYQGESLEHSLCAQQPRHDAEEARETPKALRELTDRSEGGMEHNEDSHALRCGTEIKQEKLINCNSWALFWGLSKIKKTERDRERKESSKDFADLTRKIFQLLLIPKKISKSERRECEAQSSSPMRRRPWSQFFLKGWSLSLINLQSKEKIRSWGGKSVQA